MTLNASTTLRHPGVVGIILHNLGTLRLFDDDGVLLVEVVGFDGEAGRAFLSQLGGQLEDITSEVVWHGREPAGCPAVPALRHWRRAP